MRTITSPQSSVVRTHYYSIDNTAGVPDAPVTDRFAYRVVKRIADTTGAGLGLAMLSSSFLRNHPGDRPSTNFMQNSSFSVTRS